jgi:replicative DNA helicase
LTTVTTRVSWSIASTSAVTVIDWLAENDGFSAIGTSSAAHTVVANNKKARADVYLKCLMKNSID